MPVVQEGASSDSTVYISHITGGESDWTDILEVDNSGDDAGTFTMKLYDDAGQLLTTKEYSVGAYGYMSIDLKKIASTAVAGTITYVDQDMNFRVAYESATGGGVAEFNLSSATADDLAFYFANFSSIVQWKGLAIMNADTTSVDVTLKAYGGGQLLGTATQTIPAMTRVRNVHTNWFPNVSLDSLERIEVESASGKLAGITITGNNELSKLLFTPAGGMGGSGSPAIMSHITGGEADWTDVLEIDNLGTDTGYYMVTVFDQYGASLDTRSYTIGAKEYETLNVKDISDRAVTGKVAITSGTLNCRLSYANKSGGVAEFNLSATTKESLSFYFANTSSVVEWKGLAIMNAGSTEASVVLAAYGSGSLLGTANVTLPGSTKTSNIVDNLFPGLTAEQVQRVDALAAGAELSGISISGNSDSSKMLFTPAN